MTTRLNVCIAAAILFAPCDAFAQFDRSCNAFQLTRLNVGLMRLPSAEASRFTPQIDGLRTRMDSLFDSSRKTERDFSKMRDRQLKAILDEGWAQSLFQKYAKAVQKEKPGLSQSELQNEAFNRLAEDPRFGEEFSKRLFKDPEHDSIAAKAFTDQSGAFHDLEREMYKKVLEVPPPQQEATPQMEIAALRYFDARAGRTVLQTSGNTRAMQELGAALDAVRQGTETSLSQRRLEPLMSMSRLVWDTPGNAVVVATESLRSTVRSAESVRLRASLDYTHLPTALAHPDQREDEIRRHTELSKAVAKTAGRAIQDRVISRETYRRLDGIRVPPPPADTARSGDWITRTTGVITDTAEQVRKIYHLE